MKYKLYVPYLFIFLAMLGLFVFRLGPLFMAGIMSFTDWSMFGDPGFVGLENYFDFFSDTTFWKIVGHTLLFSLIFVPIIVFGSLILAVLLNQGVKGTTAFRAMYFAPVITSTVAVGIVWRWIFGADVGMLNFLLRSLGVGSPPSWLSDRSLSLLVVAVVFAWKRLGYYMVLYLAGLQDIPKTLYEAARIDGAGPFTVFFRITVPLITPIMFFIMIMAVVDSFKNFDIIYTMTRGGPGTASTTMAYYIYQHAFELFQMGQAASLSMVLLVIVGSFSYLNFIYKSRWVQTQG